MEKMNGSQSSNKLHTEALAEKFGPITVNVLRHSSRVRETLLVDSKGVARTYALTILQNKDWTKEVGRINELVREGSALGQEFRKNNFDTRKNIIDVYTINLPRWLQKEFNTKHLRAKARLSEFLVKKKNSRPVLYGIVVEIYTPYFQSPKISTFEIKEINATLNAFKQKDIPEKEIWSRLEEDRSWDDVYDKFVMAKALSLPEIIKYKKKIENHLNKSK